eukprot:TRINITY_DN870_c0_g2_i2.p1 TRINITY_DN870_c0_g2~~TRINITY_DN870_c0_g2_i2.p1  ORF type:complete len:460 (+),score=164.56 TRINITY_DN870_c0_g2_i2:591-1970(+)
MRYRSHWMGSEAVAFTATGTLTFFSHCYGRLVVHEVATTACGGSGDDDEDDQAHPTAAAAAAAAATAAASGEGEEEDDDDEEEEESPAFDVFMPQEPTPTELAAGIDDFPANSALWNRLADLVLVRVGDPASGRGKDYRGKWKQLDALHALRFEEKLPESELPLVRKDAEFKLPKAGRGSAPQLGGSVVLAFSRAAVMSNVTSAYLVNRVVRAEQIPDCVYVDGADNISAKPIAEPQAFPPDRVMALYTGPTSGMLHAQHINEPFSVMAVCTGGRAQRTQTERRVRAAYLRCMRSAGAYSDGERSQPFAEQLASLGRADSAPVAATFSWTPSPADVLDAGVALGSALPVFVTSNQCAWAERPHKVLQQHARAGDMVAYVKVVCMLPQESSTPLRFVLGEVAALCRRDVRREVTVTDGQHDCEDFIARHDAQVAEEEAEAAQRVQKTRKQAEQEGAEEDF